MRPPTVRAFLHLFAECSLILSPIHQLSSPVQDFLDTFLVKLQSALLLSLCAAEMNQCGSFHVQMIFEYVESVYMYHCQNTGKKKKVFTVHLLVQDGFTNEELVPSICCQH